MLLATAFYNELGSVANQTYTRTTLGDIMLRSKIAVGDRAYTRDMVESFTLSGDPSMPLPAATVVTSDSPKSSGLFGCSAFAGEGQVEQVPWNYGVLNILFLFFIGFLLNASGKFVNSFVVRRK